MPVMEDSHPRLADPRDDDVVQYQAVSALAVVGLIAGLLASTALLTPALWFVSLAGIAVNGLALWRIARQTPALVGRKAALAGMGLSIFFGAAGLGDWLAYRLLITREAREVAAAWFDQLQHDQPHKAHQLTRHPNIRLPLGDKLWKDYFEGSDLRMDLQTYVAKAEVRSLLALGDKAQVRFYRSAGPWQESGRDIVGLVYAVTIPKSQAEGGKQTFFVNLILERHHLAAQARADWQITSTEGGVLPDGTKPDPQ